jgi:hypothetical protein
MGTRFGAWLKIGRLAGQSARCVADTRMPRGAVIQLRLLAGVFRLVLTGRAPELVRFYPCLGGTAPPSQAWPVMRNVVAAHIDELHAALARARQRLGEVGLEYDLHDQRDVKPELRTRLWSPDGDHSIRECLLGIAHDHGVPVTLAADGS